VTESRTTRHLAQLNACAGRKKIVSGLRGNAITKNWSLCSGEPRAG